MSPRRALFALPALLLAPAPRAALAVPPFPSWVGRTALLRGDGGAARLLLTGDGRGTMAVKLLVFCRSLPIRAWRLTEDGLGLSYSRPSVLDPSRIIEGEARILPEAGQVLWVEAQSHTAAFEGFAAPEAANRCS